MARRRRSNILRNLLRALIGAAAVVVLVAVLAAGAAMLLIDPNGFKPQIEAAARRATGRELALRGPIHVAFGLPPTLVAQDIAVANPPGYSRPEMLTLARLEARVALLPLLAGEVDVVRLDLIQPDVLLETDAAGRRNWQTAPPAGKPQSPPAAGGSSGGSAPGRETRFALRAMHLRDGHIAWRDAVSGRGGEMALPRLDAEGGGPDASLVLSGQADIGGRTLALSGETGSISRLLDAKATSPWPVQVVAQNEATRLAVRGSLLSPLKASGYTLQVDATSTDLAPVAPFLPQGVVPPHDMSLAAQISDAGGGAPSLSAMTLHVGDFRSPQLPAGVEIVRADMSAPGLTQPLHADVQATVGGAPLHVVATVGTLAALLPGAPQGAVPLDLTLESGGATLTAKGSVTAGSRTVDAAVSARIPDLALLGPLAGHTLPSFKQIAWDGHVSGAMAAGGTLALRKTSLTMPQAQMSGDLDIGLGARPSVRGAVSAARIDLDGLVAALAPPPAPAAGAGPAAAAPKPDKPAHVIPDEPLDLSALDRQDADVQVAIAALQTGGVTYSDIAGHLVLQAGRLALDPFAGTTPGGRLDAKLAIDIRPAEPPVSVALHAPAIALQPIAAALGDPGAVSGTAFVDADLHGAGRTPHAIAASLDGHVGLAVSDGEVDNRTLGIALGGVLKAAKLPESAVGGMGSTKLRCLVLRMDASHGKVTVPTLVADASRVLVQGGGTLDLGQETLDLHLRPMLRAGPGIVVPVRVGGGFRDPKIAPDLGGGKGGLLGSLAAVVNGEKGSEACGPALAAVRGPEAAAAATAATAATPAPAAPPPAPSAAPAAKPPKPIDVLRGLLH